MASKEVIRTERAPAPFQGAPYSQAIRFDQLVFVSGQLALDPETNQMVDGGIEEQTEQVMKNLRAILEEAGSSPKQLLKTTIFLADLGDFAAVNEVYAKHVGNAPPARATFQVSALPQGAKIEIEAIAHI
jgi:2-iminobutanoate/2-iminopropanoate deaminase